MRYFNLYNNMHTIYEIKIYVIDNVNQNSETLAFSFQIIAIIQVESTFSGFEIKVRLEENCNTTMKHTN